MDTWDHFRAKMSVLCYVFMYMYEGGEVWEEFILKRSKLR
jgi:hypothetical protein